MESNYLSLGNLPLEEIIFVIHLSLDVASYLNSTIIKGILVRHIRDTFPPAERYAGNLNYWIKYY